MGDSDRRDDGSATEPRETPQQTLDISLTIRQTALASFLVGLVFGGLFMAAVPGTTGMLTALADGSSGGPTDTGSPGDSGSGNSDVPVDNQKLAQNIESVSADFSSDGEPVLGDPDAPVTMVMFEDFECPFCKRFEQNAVQQIKSNYVDTGKVKVVWKDLPLPERIHPWADDSAKVMECVYRQDSDVFWAVKDKIFENQKSITQDNVESKIKDWAAAEGVTKSAIDNCLANGSPMDAVDQNKQEAQSNGATGTPTVFINGWKVTGALPYSAYEQLIENELNS
jgi:protein-disulfide isomerase